MDVIEEILLVEFLFTFSFISFSITVSESQVLISYLAYFDTSASFINLATLLRDVHFLIIFPIFTLFSYLHYFIPLNSCHSESTKPPINAQRLYNWPTFKSTTSVYNTSTDASTMNWKPK